MGKVFSSIFFRGLWKTDTSCWNIGKILHWSYLFLVFDLREAFLKITNLSISLLVINQLIFLSLVVCVFLEICPFHLSYIICYIVIHSIPLPSYFCKVDRSTPSFIPDLSNLSLLSLFFLVSLSIGIDFIIFSKNQLLFLLIFLYCFYLPSLFILPLIFFMSFRLFALVCS